MKIDTYEMMMATKALYNEEPDSVISSVTVENGELLIKTADGRVWAWDGLDIWTDDEIDGEEV